MAVIFTFGNSSRILCTLVTAGGVKGLRMVLYSANFQSCLGENLISVFQCSWTAKSFAKCSSTGKIAIINMTSNIDN